MEITFNKETELNIQSFKPETFYSNEHKREAVEEFFKELKSEQFNHISSNVIGYAYDEENFKIGYIEEHYIDSGSTDYYYTMVIHK